MELAGNFLERKFSYGIPTQTMAVSITEIVAWWGAILATIVFIWDIIKWRLAGPKLRLRVVCNMKPINVPEYVDKNLIYANLENYGDRSTTITHMTFVHYSNIWKRVRYKHEEAMWVSTPNIHFPLPHELKPGKMWQGIAYQDEILNKVGPSGFLMCEIFHTHRKRPIRKRVLVK
jgi:hypothetical protein